jgi:hypothetical protein
MMCSCISGNNHEDAPCTVPDFTRSWEMFVFRCLQSSAEIGSSCQLLAESRDSGSERSTRHLDQPTVRSVHLQDQKDCN